MTTFNCPRCQKPFDSSSYLPGNRINCQSCGYSAMLNFAPVNPPPPTGSGYDPLADDPRRSIGGATSPYSSAGSPPPHHAPPHTPPTKLRRGMFQHLRRGFFLTAVIYLPLLLIAWIFSFKAGLVTKFTGDSWSSFISGTWTSYVAVLLTCWSLSILYEKRKSIRAREKLLTGAYHLAGFSFNTDEEVTQAIATIQAKGQQLQDSLLGKRLQRALETFRASGDLKQVGDVLREESDADFSDLQEDYTLVRVFLWTIPILGFIGTVIGVSNAVGGFSSFLSSAQEMDQIKIALGEVTAGLAVAFDTTFVALVLSVLVMLVMSYVERHEQGQLRAFDDYCHDHLLARLPAQPAKAAPSVGEGLTQTLREFISSLGGAWQDEARALANSLSHSLKESWEKAGKDWFAGLSELKTSLSGQQSTLDQMAKERAGLQATAANQLAQMQKLFESGQIQLKQVLEVEQRAVTEAVNKQHNMVQQQVGALLRASGKLADLVELQNKLEDGLLRAQGSDGLAAVLVEVRQALQTLNPVMSRLVDKPIDVAVHFVAGPTT